MVDSADATNSRGGSAPAPHLEFATKGSLRRALGHGFFEIVDAAAAAAGSRAPDAVHQTRKSIRRSRALLKLLAAGLPDELYSALDTQLRDAHRALSASRDAQVLVATFDRYGGEQLPLALRERLARASGQVRAPETTELLFAVASALHNLAPLVEAELGAMRWADLERALARSWRRAKNALRRTEDIATAHRFRKRNKTVVYQLELFASLGGKQTRKRRKQLAALSEQLGEIADLGAAQAFLAALDGGPTSADGPRQPPIGSVTGNPTEPLAAVGAALAAHAAETLVHAISEGKRRYRGCPADVAAETIRRARRRR